MAIQIAGKDRYAIRDATGRVLKRYDKDELWLAEYEMIRDAAKGNNYVTAGNYVDIYDTVDKKIVLGWRDGNLFL